MTELSKSARRFRERMAEAGHEIDVVALSSSTRTAKEAADTIGCSVAQIAKSIVFRTAAEDRPVIVVASGTNRVSVDKVSALVGEELLSANGAFVKKTIGYAIGGVPPAGHDGNTVIVLDEDLKQFDEVWAAAGTPFAVFRVEPGDLPALTGSDWSDIAE